MRYQQVSIAGLLVLAACSFNIPPHSGQFACEPNGACPDNQVCRDQLCVPIGAEPPTCTSAVTAGNEHTCAIGTGGKVWCWGRNNSGQLGDGMTMDRTEPVQVEMLTGIIAISAGGAHSCAIGAGGKVWCWGRNSAGQLGDGTMGNSSTPVPVIDASGAVMSDAVAIVTGDEHSCARLGDLTVMCWGDNGAGQLGDGGTESRGKAQRVMMLADVTAIAAGGDTTCAVDLSQTLKCWGANNEGQLGAGMPQMSLPVPTVVTIPGGAAVAAVAVGDQFACARTSDGAVLCFGNNEDGQLGGAVVDSSRTPVPVAPLPKAVAITAGDRFACVTDDDAGVWCWGEDSDVQLADGGDDDHAKPSLSSYTNIKDFDGGGVHLCTLSMAGEIACSGYNGHGQLGDGHRTTQGMPQAIGQLTGVTSLSGGDAHMCATLQDKTVRCWGRNASGELGDGSFLDRDSPVVADGVSGVLQIAAGGHHSCALLKDGTAQCWGDNENGELGDGTRETGGKASAVFGLTGAKQLAAGAAHTCALTDPSGLVKCWGAGLPVGTDGQDMLLPVAVNPVMGALDADVLGIAAGNEHTCALNKDGTVACWGAGSHGQLGNTTFMESKVPVAVTDLDGVGRLGGVDQLAAHGDFTCAHISSGSVVCWGQNDHDELGFEDDHNRAVPQVIPGLSDRMLSIAAGFNHACARKPDGTGWCWGGNYVGQLGDGGYENHGTPVQIPMPSGIHDIAAGDEFTCAVLGDTTVSCWGDDRRNQLADGIRARETPVAPLILCP